LEASIKTDDRVAPQVHSVGAVGASKE